MAAPLLFFFNDTATTEIYTLSLHDALPISSLPGAHEPRQRFIARASPSRRMQGPAYVDRKSTRLNSSHSQISYAVFCLKKKMLNIAGICNNEGNVVVLMPHPERSADRILGP